MKRARAFLLMSMVAAMAGCGGARIAPVDTSLAAGVNDADELFTSLLQDRVNDGAVDYAGLSSDRRLDRYVAWLAVTDPESLTSAGALALWINAYNAYTLKLIADNYPVESIHNLHSGGKIIGFATKRTAWDKRFVVVGAETYSLNDVEHEIIRKRFDDFRIHFALVCAAVSCPPLRNEAYAADRLDAQLDDQGRRFLADAAKNHFDAAEQTAHLSPILKWYRKDFGETDADVLRAIAPYVPGATLRGQMESQAASWKIEYTHYDWDLNE